jgi:hypothetical protein
VRAVCCEANDTQIFCVFSLSLIGEEEEEGTRITMTMKKKREREHIYRERKMN